MRVMTAALAVLLWIGWAPPPQATQVMKLVIDARLPISMSTKPDYSDVLLPDGSTRPRAQR